MFEAFAVLPVNHLLRSNGWALDRLRPHAGKTVLLVCPPFESRFSITDAGEVARAPREAETDLTIAMTPGLLLRLAARDDAAWNEAQVQGDMELAAAIDHLRRNLKWDYEEDLSRFVGDIAAHRMASAARVIERWGRDTALNVARAAAEYAVHENPQVASAQAIEEFNREVDRLRDDIERLEKRIDLVQQLLSAESQHRG